MTSHVPPGNEYDNAVPKLSASEVSSAPATEHSSEDDYEELNSNDGIAETGVDDSSSGGDQSHNTATRATASQVRPYPANEPSPEGVYMELL